MRNLPTKGASWGSALALGLSVGLCLRWTVERAGSAPIVLGGVAAAILCGVAFVRAWPWRARSRGARVGLLLLASALAWFAPDVSWSMPSALGLGAISLGLLGGATALSHRIDARAALLALGPGLLVGFELPLLALPGLLALTAILNHKDEIPEAPQAISWGARGLGATLVGLGAALASAGYGAGRTLLDGSPRGAVWGAAALCVWMALASLLRPAARAREAALPLGLAALLLVGLVRGLHWAGVTWIGPLAGVQDPRPHLFGLSVVLLLPGALVLGRGLAWGRSALTPLCAALGLGLGLNLGPDARVYALGLAAIAGLLAALLSGHWARRLVGAGLAVAAALGSVSLPWSEPQLLQSLALSLRGVDDPRRAEDAVKGQEPQAGGWGPDGSILVMQKGKAAGLSFLDGLALSADGREADAERLLGHLGAALTPGRERALILGEARGLVSAALTQQTFGRVEVTVVQPEGLRARALQDPRLAETLLHPTVTLRYGPPELALSTAPPQDLIVELLRLPWALSEGGLPSPTRLAARRDALGPEGAYVLLLPLTWMQEGELRAELAAILKVFPTTWAFLPARGADHMILVSWKQAPEVPWERVERAVKLGLPTLSPLSIRNPEDLADRAWAGPDALAAFAESGSGVNPWGPGPGLHLRPSLLWPTLSGSGSDPSGWLGEGAPFEELRRRLDMSRRLLELLAQAREGDIRGVVSESRMMSQDAAGQRALDPLMEPYLQRAKAALAEGMSEGPQSTAWSRCIKEVESARLLNPRSAPLHAMAGRCRLAQGDLRRAEEEFDQALALDPGDLESLLGSAQVLSARGELARAEARLRDATRYNPAQWRPWYHLGAMLLDLNRLSEAEAALAQARGLAGEEGGLAAGAEAHLALLKGDPNAALVHAERAVQLDPSAKHLHLRGLCWLALDQTDRAERDFREAVYADPMWWPAHGDLGRIFASRGEYAQAIDAFERVLNAEPGNAAAQQNLQRAKGMLAEEEGR